MSSYGYGAAYPAPFSSVTFDPSNFPPSVKSAKTAPVPFSVSTTNLSLSGNLVVAGDTTLNTLTTSGPAFFQSQVTANGGIINVNAPISSNELVNKRYVDNNFYPTSATALNASKLTLTNTDTALISNGSFRVYGDATVSTDPTNPDHVVNLQYANSHYLVNSSSALSCSSVAASGAISANSLTGGTIAGSSLTVTGPTTLAGTLAANGGITSTHVPTDSNDVVTKGYGDVHYTINPASNITCSTLTASTSIASSALNVSGAANLRATSIHGPVTVSGALQCNGGIQTTHTPSNPDDVMTKTYADSHYLASGGAISCSSLTCTGTMSAGGSSSFGNVNCYGDVAITGHLTGVGISGSITSGLYLFTIPADHTITVTPSSITGYWIKIGKLVTLSAHFHMTYITGGSDVAVYIGGLPIPTESVPTYIGGEMVCTDTDAVTGHPSAGGSLAQYYTGDPTVLYTGFSFGNLPIDGGGATYVALNCTYTTN